MSSTEGSGASRAGGHSLHNEDAFLVEEGLGLYVVCDGVGGRPGGEVAAKLATRALEDFVERSGRELDLPRAHVARALVDKAMGCALVAVDEAVRTEPDLRGLSTTITMLLTHGDRGVIGHRGDSRAYLLRRGRAHQLTIDHELSEAASVETGGDLIMDVFGVDLEPSDTVVLCSDGAEAVLEDREFVRSAGDLSPRALASRIVSTAHRRNPVPDATAVVVRVRGEHEPGWLELSLPPLRTSFGHTLEYA
ncbi:MAG: serine/threonine-protein phosphatase [Myxococcales bacterium]|nr:serine/threonine-protein phosphatase [Myxococcales bacterium]